jgi:hypothetical protein
MNIIQLTDKQITKKINLYRVDAILASMGTTRRKLNKKIKELGKSLIINQSVNI